MMDDEQRNLHWRRTLRLMAVAMIMTGGLLAIAAPFIPWLNQYSFLRFPLGYFAIAQGAIIMLIAAAYWFTGEQERLDRHHGITNEF